MSTTGNYVKPTTSAAPMTPKVSAKKAVPASIVTIAAGLLAGVATRSGLDSITPATLEGIANKAIALDTILTVKANN